MSETLVDLSRPQFAVTAMYPFLFAPLTLGLSFLLVIMEALYVMTGKPIYKNMVKFWGKLFGINFALGVTTSITMEFQFGANWAYYSHYIGDIFGALPTPLSVSILSVGNLYGSLAGFIGFYTLPLVVALYLMFKFARLAACRALVVDSEKRPTIPKSDRLLGPSSLGTGKYHFEGTAA